MNAVESAIYSRLNATAAVTALLAKPTSIFNLRAPAAEAYPLIVYALQAGTDDNTSPHRERQVLYQVKGITFEMPPGGGQTVADAGAIDAACDTALHMVPLTVTGWTNIWLVRQSDIRYIEDLPNGRRFYHAGGLYRIWIGT